MARNHREVDGGEGCTQARSPHTLTVLGKELCAMALTGEEVTGYIAQGTTLGIEGVPRMGAAILVEKQAAAPVHE